MAARDVVTAAALQLMSMADKGREDGVLVATVTVPVNATDGEVGAPGKRCGRVVHRPRLTFSSFNLCLGSRTERAICLSFFHLVFFLFYCATPLSYFFFVSRADPTNNAAFYLSVSDADAWETRTIFLL